MVEYYEVWKYKFRLGFQDPDALGIRFHTIIYVQTDAPNGVGYIHHVIGDLATPGGMTYERRLRSYPDMSLNFSRKEFLGYVDASTYPESMDTVLLTLPLPPQQKAFNRVTGKTEPFKTLNPLTFYSPGEPQRPLFKCTEWIEHYAIPALQTAGILR